MYEIDNKIKPLFYNFINSRFIVSLGINFSVETTNSQLKIVKQN